MNASQYWPTTPETSIYIINNIPNYGKKTKGDILKVKEKNFQVTIELLKKNISLDRNDIMDLISTGNYHKLRFMYNYSASIREAIDNYLDHDEFLIAIAFNDVQTVQKLLKSIETKLFFKIRSK